MIRAEQWAAQCPVVKECNIHHSGNNGGGQDDPSRDMAGLVSGRAGMQYSPFR